MFTTLTILLVVNPILTKISQAELIECDGVWSNKPCEGKINKQIDEVVVTDTIGQKATVDDLTSSKSELVQAFERFVFDASRKLKQKVDTTPILVLCNQEQTSLKDCSDLIKEHQMEIQSIINKRQEIEQKQPEIVDNTHNTNVVVIQGDTYLGYPDVPTPTRSGLSPDFETGPFGKEPPIKSQSGNF